MKVSIITVTYNAEDTIARTLESVAMQTYPDIEHLIIDGASKDRTVEIARQYPHATIFSEPDKGLYDAMNKGLQYATGDFLCFLNAGDKLHSKDTIAKIAAPLLIPEQSSPTRSLSPQGGKNNPHGNSSPLGEAGRGLGVLYGDTHIMDAQGNFLRNRRLTPPEHLTWRSFKEGMLVCHQAFYINRQIALPYDLTYRFSADFDWCIRCMKEGEQRGMKNLYIREPLADYLSEGMTTANQQASLKERFRIMAKHYGLATTIIQHIWFIVRALVKK
ncbi:MAG: glycosyltransferase [Bacteroidaceae bacterium]|nr:glycosyltransferase [Bacteroidaceae bacterium]